MSNTETTRATDLLKLDVAPIPCGKRRRWGSETDYPAQICHRPTGYVLIVSTLNPESHDDDPGSVMCGCAFSGRCHSHHTATFETLEEAVATLWAKRNGSFARAERIA